MHNQVIICIRYVWVQDAINAINPSHIWPHDMVLRSRSQSLLQQKQLCARNFQILWLEDLGMEIGDLPHHHHDNHVPFYFLMDQNFKLGSVYWIFIANYILVNHSFLLFCICGQFIINLNRKYRFRLTDWLIDSSKNSQLIKSLPDLGRHLWTARHYPVRFDWDNSTVAQRYDGPTVAGWF